MILAKKAPIWFLLTTSTRDMVFTMVFTLTLFLIHLEYSFFTIPISISALLGTAMALILSFRLAQSYDRWWEARIIWGSIVNDSRTLTMQVLNFSSDEETIKAKEIAKLQIAWVNSLSTKLRNQKLDQKLLKKYLSEDSYNEISKKSNPVLQLSNIISSKADQLSSLSEYKKMQIDDTLVRLVASMGASERIKNTVFPSEYPLYLHLSIYMFLAFMSVSLANLGHHWEIFFILLIAAPFFLLEKAAEHLQDPFEDRPTDVPISSISRTIEINILELLDEKDIPQPLQNKGFYID